MPSTKRSPDSAWSVIAAIAAAVGVRAPIWTIAVPTTILSVWASAQAAGVIASEP